MDNKALDLTQNTRHLQMTSIDDMKVWYSDFVRFSKEILKENLDYGKIPGVAKPTLLKPGAEKLRFVYGLGVEMTQIATKEDDQTKTYDYTYKASVRSKSGQILAECEGNANSHESKWKYNWIPSDKRPAKEEAEKLKAQKLGKWGKTDSGWVWLERQENPDILGLKNTLIKMAQKRAFVGAMLIATGASEFFTQDVEDMVIDDEQVKTEPIKAEVVESKEVKNRYEASLNALLKANLITKEQYDEVINDQVKSFNLISKLKEERSAKTQSEPTPAL